MAGDPYFNQVALLLPMTGANQSTTFTDASSAPKTVTAFGHAKISNVQSKWGESSGYFDGSGDYLGVAPANDLAFLTNDFTVEGFVYITGANVCWIAGNAGAAAQSGWAMAARHPSFGNLMRFYHYGTGTGYNGVTPVTLSAWHHVAFSRQAGTLRGFLDGYLEFSATVTTSFTDDQLPRIGAIGGTTITAVTTSAYFQGMRWTNNVARYTANFTPPTEPFPTTGLFAPIAGNCIVSGNGGAEQVVIRDWVTRELQAIAIPASNGDWTAEVPLGTCDITYFAAGCQPICHGPYTVTAD